LNVSIKTNRFFRTCRAALTFLGICTALSSVAADPSSTALRPAGNGLDDTGGFIHLTPGVIQTNNGCSEFSVSIVATLTDARVFGLSFAFDQSNLELLSVTPGSDPRLNLLPTQLSANTLRVDGFFHPNFPAGAVTLATLTVKAIAPFDTTTAIGFVNGNGFSGTTDTPQPIMLSGDTATVIVDGTPPRPPDSLIIITLPYPAHDDSVRLQWRRVTQDIHGHPVNHPQYTIYLHDVLNDTSLALATLPDTFLYDEFIHITFPCTTVVNIGVYEVRACKTQP
jgi:hypothetical protein